MDLTYFRLEHFCRKLRNNRRLFTGTSDREVHYSVNIDIKENRTCPERDV